VREACRRGIGAGSPKRKEEGSGIVLSKRWPPCPSSLAMLNLPRRCGIFFEGPPAASPSVLFGAAPGLVACCPAGPPAAHGSRAWISRSRLAQESHL
jgi:hypothetical protein